MGIGEQFEFEKTGRIDPETPTEYQKGRRAFKNGKSSSMNPYASGTAKYQAWLKGYIDADAQETGEFDNK